MIPRLHRFRLVAVFLLALQCAGCVTWQPTTAQRIQDERPEEVRIRYKDGDWKRVEQPEIIGDSIDGLGVSRRALDDVLEIKDRRFSALGTTLGVATVVGLYALATWFRDALAEG